MQRPQTFRFTQLDVLCPNTTVVAMEGPRQQVVEIQSHSASLPVDEHSGEEKLLRDAKISGMRTEREVCGPSLDRDLISEHCGTCPETRRWARVSVGSTVSANTRLDDFSRASGSHRKSLKR